MTDVELATQYAAFERDLIPVLKQLRGYAHNNPDLHQPSPTAEQAAPTTTRPAEPRPLGGNTEARLPAREPTQADNSKNAASGETTQSPALPSRFATEAAFDKAMGWDAMHRCGASRTTTR